MDMSSKTTFHVKKRPTAVKFGSSQRKLGNIPGNVFGLKKESEAIEMLGSAFGKLFASEGDTGLIYLSIEGEKQEQPVLISEVQRHAVTGEIIHASFKRVNLKQEIEASISIELVGENAVPDSTALLVIDSLTVKALPADLPEKFELDISKFTEVGQSITIADLAFDRSKVSLVLSGETSEESPVVILQEVKEEVIEAEVNPEDVQIEEKGKEETDAAGGQSQPPSNTESQE